MKKISFDIILEFNYLRFGRANNMLRFGRAGNVMRFGNLCTHFL